MVKEVRIENRFFKFPVSLCRTMRKKFEAPLQLSAVPQLKHFRSSPSPKLELRVARVEFALEAK